MEINIGEKTICLIEEPEELETAGSFLRLCDTIAVDTESDSLFVYYEKVCLIQISGGGRNYIFDPLKLGDLSLLGELFANPNIEKIFHAAEYDIMCLKRDFAFTFENLFDTMIAARTLGLKEIGYAALVSRAFDIALEKKYQKANWGVRPLSTDMLDYASKDTQYLEPLRNRIYQELYKNNLSEIAKEDFARLCALPPYPPEQVETNWWRIAKNKELTALQISVLQNLCHVRDQASRRCDLPPFKLASGDALLNIALEHPQSEKEIFKIKGLAPSFRRRFSKDILVAVKQGSPSEALPKPDFCHRISPEELFRREHIHDWRKKTAEIFEVGSEVVLPKDVMEKIVIGNPQTDMDLQKIMRDVPNRFDRFGEGILQAIKPRRKQTAKATHTDIQ